MNGSLLCPLLILQPFAKMVRPPHRCSRALFYGFSSLQKPPCRGPAFPASLNPHRLDWIVTKPLPPRPLRVTASEDFFGSIHEAAALKFPRPDGRGRRLKSGEIPAHGGQFPVRRSKFPARLNKFPVRHELIPCFIL